MKQFSIYVAFVLVSVLSCKPSNSSIEKTPTFATPEIVDTLLIQTQEDFAYGYLPIWQHRAYRDTSYLIFSNATEAFLQLLVLDNHSLTYQDIITLPKNGPNGFKTDSPNFYWHNPDSIFVFPTSLNRVLLYDAKGTLVNTVDYQADIPINFGSNAEQQGGVLLNNKFYVNTIPYANPKSIDFTQKTHVSHKLNLQESTLEVFSSYPEELKNKFIPSSFLGGQIVQAFDSLLFINNIYSEGIDYYNLNLNTFGNINAGVSGFRHLKGLDQPVDGMSTESVGMQMKYPMYDIMLFDSYKQVLYRFTRHLNPKFKNFSVAEIYEKIEASTLDLMYNTLIVISPNKEKKYYKLPYDVSFALPTKDGLLIRATFNDLEEQDVYLKLKLSEDQ